MEHCSVSSVCRRSDQEASGVASQGERSSVWSVAVKCLAGREEDLTCEGCEAVMNGERDHEVTSVEEHYHMGPGAGPHTAGRAWVRKPGGRPHKAVLREPHLAPSNLIQFEADGFVVDVERTPVRTPTPRPRPAMDPPRPRQGPPRSHAAAHHPPTHKPTTAKSPKATQEGSDGRGGRQKTATGAASDGWRCSIVQEKVNIYETTELRENTAFRYYTAGGVSVVVDPESGVQDGTWKPAQDESASVDFLTSRPVCCIPLGLLPLH